MRGLLLPLFLLLPLCVGCRTASHLEKEHITHPTHADGTCVYAHFVQPGKSPSDERSAELIPIALTPIGTSNR